MRVMPSSPHRRIRVKYGDDTIGSIRWEIDFLNICVFRKETQNAHTKSARNRFSRHLRMTARKMDKIEEKHTSLVVSTAAVISVKRL